MFVATANTLNIPAALLDRMEVIRLSGYTEDEKVAIATRYLLPKQMRNNGLKDGELTVSESAVRDIIRYYTREAGVRSLEREVGKICRKVVRRMVLKKGQLVVEPSAEPRAQSKDPADAPAVLGQGTGAAQKTPALGKIHVNAANLDQFLSVRRYSYGVAEKENQVGQVTGLAWTEVGGELLTIEAVSVPGKGLATFTGKLGDVMQESIKAAMTVVRRRAHMFGLKPDFHEKRDIHIHVPEGATPKDGPSAGIAMTTALVSVLTGIPVRADVAMTGEVTLRGEVLAIGGLKEKLLAALRGGIKRVLIPEENTRDLPEIPDNVKNNLEIIPVRWIDRVLELALERLPQPLPEEDVAEAVIAPATTSPVAEVSVTGDRVKH
jgi:ATP-dependent Lon protease